MAVAWRYAQLQVSTHDAELHQWTLPFDECIEDSGRAGRRIPASLWRSALPVFQLVVTRTDGVRPRHHRLRQLLQCEQPTDWIVVRHGADGSWKAVVDESATEQSVDVRRVEVLRDVD